MSPIVNRRDLDFHLFEVEALDDLFKHDRYAEHDRATVTAIIDTAQQIAETYYQPCAARLDANEPGFDGERVVLISEVAEALGAYADAGFFSAGFDEELGGFQLPAIVTNAVAGIFSAANLGVANYHFLTIAAAHMLAEFGTDTQKQLYLGPMLEGRCFGTMCLSEPQAGSSLSDITTRAVPTDADHFLIRGSKMWISGGDHEISENIVHMVLAKVPGGPPGVKGISLFIVPKYRVNPDGTTGPKNNVALAGLNHKMGQRGTTNTLLNFGEQGECHGFLVGELHQGLRYMFHMMNEARVGVGLSAAMCGLAGFLCSLQYAQERAQGRPVAQKDPSTPQTAIIRHADIRRLLFSQKASVEGAMSLIFHCCALLDQEKMATTPEARREAKLLLDILTPIAKSWPSEFCLEANKHAIQILGGYGYTREFPVERLYRDNRLNLIHEGTHGIQGLDLLGRKVDMQNGAALDLLIGQMMKDIRRAATRDALQDFSKELTDMVGQLKATTRTLMACDDIERRLANATLYLDAFGHVVIAWMWLRQANVATVALQCEDKSETAFYRGKLQTCRYFFRYELPRVSVWTRLLESLDDTCVGAGPEIFA